MSLRLLQFVVALMLPFVGCSRSGAPSASNAPASQPKVVQLTDDELLDLVEPLYVQCEDDEAETFLDVRVTIPNAMDNYPFRIPLCRRKIRRLDYPMLYLGFNSDGVSADGFGIGHGGHIGIYDATDTSVTVSLSLYWTATDRTRGKFDELLPVTIGKPSVKKLDGDVEIRWMFQDPVKATKAGDGNAT